MRRMLAVAAVAAAISLLTGCNDPSPVTGSRQPTRSTQSSVYYKDCDAAREAGAAPLRKGDPGYRSELDRNNDGVACSE